MYLKWSMFVSNEMFNLNFAKSLAFASAVFPVYFLCHAYKYSDHVHTQWLFSWPVSDLLGSADIACLWIAHEHRLDAIPDAQQTISKHDGKTCIQKSFFIVNRVWLLNRDTSFFLYVAY